MTPRARLRLERHNARVLERHLDEWSPDLVAWWPMGGMSLSLLERVHRAGFPSVAVVMDDWPTYGPKVDAWQAPLYRRPRRGRLAERLTGVPSLGDLGSRTRWIFISRHQLEQTESALGALPGARVAHAGVDERAVPRGARASVALAAPLLRPDRPAQGHRPGRRGAAAPAGRGDACASSATATPSTARSCERQARELGVSERVHVRARRSRPAAADLRRARRPAVPGALAGAVGARAARGDGGGPARRRERPRRLGRVPRRRRELPARRSGRRGRAARRRPAPARGRTRAARPPARGRACRPPSATPTPRSRARWQTWPPRRLQRLERRGRRRGRVVEHARRARALPALARAGRRVGARRGVGRRQRLDRRLARARPRALRLGRRSRSRARTSATGRP